MPVITPKLSYMKDYMHSTNLTLSKALQASALVLITHYFYSRLYLSYVILEHLERRVYISTQIPKFLITVLTHKKSSINFAKWVNKTVLTLRKNRLSTSLLGLRKKSDNSEIKIYLSFVCLQISNYLNISEILY